MLHLTWAGSGCISGPCVDVQIMLGNKFIVMPPFSRVIRITRPAILRADSRMIRFSCGGARLKVSGSGPDVHTVDRNCDRQSAFFRYLACARRRGPTTVLQHRVLALPGVESRKVHVQIPRCSARRPCICNQKLAPFVSGDLLILG